MGVFDLLRKRQCLPLHNFLLYCSKGRGQRHRTACCQTAPIHDCLLVEPGGKDSGGVRCTLCTEEHGILSVTADLLNLVSSGNRTSFHLMRSVCSFTVKWLLVSQSNSLCLD